MRASMPSSCTLRFGSGTGMSIYVISEYPSEEYTCLFEFTDLLRSFLSLRLLEHLEIMDEQDDLCLFNRFCQGVQLQ